MRRQLWACALAIACAGDARPPVPVTRAPEAARAAEEEASGAGSTLAPEALRPLRRLHRAAGWSGRGNLSP